MNLSAFVDSREALIGLNKLGVDSSLQFYKKFCDTAGHLVGLQSESLKALLEDNNQYVKELGAVTTVPAYLAWCSKLSEANVEKGMSNSGKTYELLSRLQAEAAQLAEERIEEISHDIARSLDKVAKGLPSADLTAGLLKTTLEITVASLSGLSKTCKQIADAGMKATIATHGRAAKASKKSA